MLTKLKPIIYQRNHKSKDVLLFLLEKEKGQTLGVELYS